MKQRIGIVSTVLASLLVIQPITANTGRRETPRESSSFRLTEVSQSKRLKPHSTALAELVITLTHSGTVKVNEMVDLTANLLTTTTLTTTRFVSATVEDGNGTTQYFSAITVGQDQLPLVSYYTGSSFKVAQCQTMNCERVIPLNTVDDTIFLSQFNYTSIAMGADGLPVMAYQSYLSGTGLSVAKCLDAKCASTIKTELEMEDSIAYSMAIPADGLPVIAYMDLFHTPSRLKVAKCMDGRCTSATIKTLDSSNVGGGMSLAIGADDLPVISYVIGSYNLKVAKCVTANCGSVIKTVVDDSGTNNVSTSLAIGPDGLPAIAYFDREALLLKFAKCETISCTVSHLETLDAAPNVDRMNGIAVGPDNLPMIVYEHESNGGLRMALCQTVSCTSSITTTVDPTSMFGAAPRLRLGADGLPVMSYSNLSGTVIRVAKALPNLVYSLNYGDGSAPVSGGWNAESLPFTHPYTVPGTYMAVITATLGAVTTTASTRVIVYPIRSFAHLPVLVRDRP